MAQDPPEAVEANGDETTHYHVLATATDVPALIAWLPYFSGT